MMATGELKRPKIAIMESLSLEKLSRALPVYSSRTTLTTNHEAGLSNDSFKQKAYRITSNRFADVKTAFDHLGICPDLILKQNKLKSSFAQSEASALENSKLEFSSGYSIRPSNSFKIIKPVLSLHTESLRQFPCLTERVKQAPLSSHREMSQEKSKLQEISEVPLNAFAKITPRPPPSSYCIKDTKKDSSRGEGSFDSMIDGQKMKDMQLSKVNSTPANIYSQPINPKTIKKSLAAENIQLGTFFNSAYNKRLESNAKTNLDARVIKNSDQLVGANQLPNLGIENQRCTIAEQQPDTARERRLVVLNKPKQPKNRYKLQKIKWEGENWEDLNKSLCFIKLLGSGAFAKVYRALELEDKRELAVKVIDKKKIDENKWRKLIEKELEINSIIQHKNICAFYRMIETSTKVVFL